MELIGFGIMLCLAYYIFVFPVIWVVRECRKDSRKRKCDELFEELNKRSDEALDLVKRYRTSVDTDEMDQDEFSDFLEDETLDKACLDVYSTAAGLINNRQYGEYRRYMDTDPFMAALRPHLGDWLASNV